MTVESCYKIGFIMKPHGLKGQVTISLDAEAPPDFDGIGTIFVQVKEQLLPFFVQTISLKGSKAFLKLEDVDTVEEAQRISKSPIFLPKSMRPKSGRGEFYDDEIVGFEVIDSSLGVIGNISEVVQAGPNKLLSVSHDGKDVLIPVNSPFIASINKSKRKITVNLPDGFLDI